jgi:hypothetical protein
MKCPKAFFAGFLSTFIFHQGLLAILHTFGLTTRVPFSFTTTYPFYVPQVISLAFWGGIWGVLLWITIWLISEKHYWLSSIIFGALCPSLIAWYVVFPLKGLPIAGGGQPKIVITSLLLNGFWGFGTALLMRIFD